MKKTPILVAVVLILAGCTAQLSQADLAERLAGAADPVAELLALDQEEPDQLSIKASLGGLYLQAGQPDLAGPYLTRGRELESSVRRDKEATYLLWANSAAWAIEVGDYSAAADYADRALKGLETDPIGAAFSRAHAAVGLGDRQGAANQFADLWDSRREEFNTRDLLAFADLLVEGAAFDDALTVYYYTEFTHGYAPGLGLLQSIVLESMGRLDESILAAFKELDTQRYYGALDEAGVTTRLRDAAAAGVSGDLLDGLISYVVGDFAQAEQLLSGPLSQMIEPYSEFLLLATRLQQGAAQEDISNFASFEAVYSGHPGFWDHMWHGMKEGDGQYSYTVARPILEQVIYLAPDTPAASAARAELGGFFGFEQTGFPLISGEIEVLAQMVMSGTPVTVLEPLVTMLTLPDNPYSAASLLTLERLAAAPVVREYLAEVATAADETTRTILAPLIGSN